MVLQGFLPVDKDIIKSKCYRNVRSGIKNAAEMLQDSDISAENLPLAADRYTAAKKFTPDNLECPSATCYLVGSIMENSEPLPGSETTLI